jgi:hypothetical protein
MYPVSVYEIKNLIYQKRGKEFYIENLNIFSSSFNGESSNVKNNGGIDNSKIIYDKVSLKLSLNNNNIIKQQQQTIINTSSNFNIEKRNVQKISNMNGLTSDLIDLKLYIHKNFESVLPVLIDLIFSVNNFSIKPSALYLGNFLSSKSKVKEVYKKIWDIHAGKKKLINVSHQIKDSIMFLLFDSMPHGNGLISKNGVEKMLRKKLNYSDNDDEKRWINSSKLTDEFDFTDWKYYDKHRIEEVIKLVGSKPLEIDTNRNGFLRWGKIKSLNSLIMKDQSQDYLIAKSNNLLPFQKILDEIKYNKRITKSNNSNTYFVKLNVELLKKNF